MFGQATLEIPARGTIGRSFHDGLSDELAMSIGRTAARTLSEQDGHVIIRLSDGDTKLIGYDTVLHKLVFGRVRDRL